MIGGGFADQFRVIIADPIDPTRKKTVNVDTLDWNEYQSLIANLTKEWKGLNVPRLYQLGHRLTPNPKRRTIRSIDTYSVLVGSVAEGHHHIFQNATALTAIACCRLKEKFEPGGTVSFFVSIDHYLV